MRNLNKVWKIGFAFIALTLFMVQSCNEADQNVAPEIDDVLSVKSADWNIVDPINVPDPCKQVCLVAGQHMNVGSVDVGVDGSDIVVTYNILEEGVYLLEVHLDVFTDEDAFADSKKVNGGGANPGQFAFHKYFSEEDMVTSFSVKVPGEYFNYEDCVFIASHAALSNGETAWGGICNESDKGVTLVNALQFPGKNWSVYFEFCADECEPSPIDFTYAWEDLLDDNNDADYNDLVVQSDVVKSNSNLTIDFYATARGASFDHAFKIKIPMLGVTSISGDAGYTNDGTYYYITVFSSTKAVLPAENVAPFLFAANTVGTDDTCEPTASAQLVLGIDGEFVFNPATPYEPFITVNPSSSNPYDLTIWEISGTDTWSEGGKEYPNGILIPDDWKWPLETQVITGPYPDFKSITDGWNSNWADNLADPSKVWDCN